MDIFLYIGLFMLSIYLLNTNKEPRKPYNLRGSCGADDAIRTRDLILTKDVLYRLSYISARGAL